MHTQAVPVFFQLREKKNQYVRIDFLISTLAIVIAIISSFYSLPWVLQCFAVSNPAQITFQSC